MTKIQVNSQGKAYISSGGKALVGASNTTILNVTPSTSAQTFTPSSGVVGYDTVNVSAVTASIDQNIVASNIKKDVTILSVTGTYEGATLITKTITQNGTYNATSDNADGYSSVTVDVGGTPTGKYQLFERVKDDNNNEIGTVCGFFTDANNVEYALVVIDNSIGRNMAWGPTTTIPDSIIYNNISQGKYWYRDEKNTATYNTQKILDAISSPLCNYCRTFSFIIEGVTYYGQMPNMRELFDIVSNNSSIYPHSTFASSTQFAKDKYYMIEYSGRITWGTKTSANAGVLPILEIPNVLS